MHTQLLYHIYHTRMYHMYTEYSSTAVPGICIAIVPAAVYYWYGSMYEIKVHYCCLQQQAAHASVVPGTRLSKKLTAALVLLSVQQCTADLSSELL